MEFREFLWKTADDMPDRSFYFHQKHYFRNLLEMAEEGDRIRLPVHIDEEDLEFLKQFENEAYWPSALYQRYKMLFNEIMKMHDYKLRSGMHQLKDAILQAIKTQNWNKLKELESHLVLPDEQIDRLKRDYGPNIQKHDSELESRADKIANKHMKEQDYWIGDPETAEFVFPKRVKSKKGGMRAANRAKEKIKIYAKPYLNRLYHRLERTAGHPHDPNSGLQGEGKYGFDMSNPVAGLGEDLPHTTAGMKFPTYTQINRRMSEFMVQNSHRNFGEISGPGIVWKKVPHMKDTETAGYYLKKFEKEIYNQYKNDTSFGTKDKVLAYAKAEANKRVIAMAERKELLGPPIPGVDERGRKSRKTTRFPVRVQRVNGKKVLVNPPLYLPYRKEVVNGKEREVLVVNPAMFYRELGTDKKDYQYETYTDEAGVEKTRIVRDAQGKPVWNVPEDQILGHDKKYVKVKDDDFKYGKEIQKDGSIDFNHNSESLHHYIPGTEEFEKVFSDIFANQKEVELVRSKGAYSLQESPGSGFTYDIMRGILDCINMKSCGEKTPFEKTKMLQNVEIIYMIIFNTMQMDLRKHLIGNLDRARGRREYARSKASMYAQKDLGGGSRRLRAMTPEARRKHRRKPRKGVRLIPANLQEYRDLKQKLAGLKNKAVAVDHEAHDAIQNAKQNISDMTVQALTKAMADRYEVANELRDLLAAIHAEYKDERSTIDSDQFAQDQIRSWVDDDYNSDQMLNAFQRMDIVQKALANSGQPQSPAAPDAEEHPSEPQQEIKAGIRMFMHDFTNDLQRAGGDVNNKLIQNKYKAKPPETVSKYVATQIKPAILAVPDFEYLRQRANAEQLKRALEAVQSEINRQMQHPQFLAGAAPVVSQAAQSPKMGAKPEGQDWLQLFQRGTPDSLYHLSQDESFHRLATNNLISAVRRQIERNSSKYHPDDYQRAMDRLEATMRQRNIRLR